MVLNRTVPGGAYIHIPFCIRKCRYCDFYSTTDLSLKGAFLNALEREIKLTDPRSLKFDSLYIGGGTPTVLNTDDICRVVEIAGRYFNILPDAELTLEVNPGTVTLDKFRRYKKIGINRLNIGVQSFNDSYLQFLDRIHTASEAMDCVQWARQAGFDNVGLDLIYGIPGQDLAGWRRDLIQTVDIAPEHISCYMLTCEGGTPLAQDVRKGRALMPLDDLLSELLYSTAAFLTANGFSHYEISNFVRKTEDESKSLVSRHNQKYWSFAPYIGLGPAAHSFIEPMRYWNTSDINTYISETEAGRLPLAEEETLTTEQLIIESIYLGLRKISGIDLLWFNLRYGLDFHSTFKQVIEELTAGGLITISETHCALSHKGLAMLDSVAAMFTNQEFGALSPPNDS
ncbi:MAG: radical SAM family heme chaperone HemW [Desulfobacterales bacterium]|jgi:oxygen-independent coproporphyrinogen-3 oxidase